MRKGRAELRVRTLAVDGGGVQDAVNSLVQQDARHQPGAQHARQRAQHLNAEVPAPPIGHLSPLLVPAPLQLPHAGNEAGLSPMALAGQDTKDTQEVPVHVSGSRGMLMMRQQGAHAHPKVCVPELRLIA